MWVRYEAGKWFNLDTARDVIVTDHPEKPGWQILATSAADADAEAYGDEHSQLVEVPTILAADLPEDLARKACDRLMKLVCLRSDPGYVDLPRIIEEVRTGLDKPSKGNSE